MLMCSAFTENLRMGILLSEEQIQLHKKRNIKLCLCHLLNIFGLSLLFLFGNQFGNIFKVTYLAFHILAFKLAIEELGKRYYINMYEFELGNKYNFNTMFFLFLLIFIHLVRSCGSNKDSR